MDRIIESLEIILERMSLRELIEVVRIATRELEIRNRDMDEAEQDSFQENDTPKGEFVPGVRYSCLSV